MQRMNTLKNSRMIIVFNLRISEVPQICGHTFLLIVSLFNQTYYHSHIFALCTADIGNVAYFTRYHCP